MSAQSLQKWKSMADVCSKYISFDLRHRKLQPVAFNGRSHVKPFNFC